MQVVKEHRGGKALADRLLSRVTLGEHADFPMAAIEELSTLDRAQSLAVQACSCCDHSMA